ncbi:hypothetical protein [Arthrobacter sp. B0490]|uniref:hypothetical protein n=1 Tax=Arthrobacter sp. B0490 TaxID=2058891 RepID=UPI0011B09D87|nr:hypothetical protein [Arthrobacter sp. B0490]
MPIHPVPPIPGRHQDRGVAPLGGDVEVPDAPGKAVQVLDPRVLQEMERDFSDPAAVHRFARDFCAGLAGKIDRLDLRIAEGDPRGAEDAVLSVTASSAMVGALRLVQAGRTTHRLIVAGNLDGARRTVALLRACAAGTVSELRDIYPEHP